MQISHVRMHAIIKERYFFPKKRDKIMLVMCAPRRLCACGEMRRYVRYKV